MGFCVFRYLCVFACVFSVFCFFVFPVSAVGSNVPTDFKSIQLKVSYVPGLEDPDIFFWPYMSRNESPFGETSPIDVFFVGKTRAEVIDFFRSRGLNGRFVVAFDEYGYRGPDLAHMSWNRAGHVEDTREKNPEFIAYSDGLMSLNLDLAHMSLDEGKYVEDTIEENLEITAYSDELMGLDLGEYEEAQRILRGLFNLTTNRYHLVLFEGGYSKKFKANWCYGNVHYDVIGKYYLPEYNISVPWHYLHKRTCDYGVRYLMSKLAVGGSGTHGCRYYIVDFDNGDGHYFTDGHSLLVVWSS